MARLLGSEDNANDENDEPRGEVNGVASAKSPPPAAQAKAITPASDMPAARQSSRLAESAADRVPIANTAEVDSESDAEFEFEEEEKKGGGEGVDKEGEEDGPVTPAP